MLSAVESTQDLPTSPWPLIIFLCVSFVAFLISSDAWMNIERSLRGETSKAKRRPIYIWGWIAVVAAALTFSSILALSIILN